jgi:hypothetical protein
MPGTVRLYYLLNIRTNPDRRRDERDEVHSCGRAPTGAREASHEGVSGHAGHALLLDCQSETGRCLRPLLLEPPGSCRSREGRFGQLLSLVILDSAVCRHAIRPLEASSKCAPKGSSTKGDCAGMRALDVLTSSGTTLGASIEIPGPSA